MRSGRSDDAFLSRISRRCLDRRGPTSAAWCPSLATEPQVADVDADEPADPVPGGWARTRLFEGVAGVLERFGEWKPPAVLVLEDLHWADRSSLDLFAFLARVLRDARVVLVGTFRLADPDAGGDDVQRLVDELSRRDGVVHLRLGQLSSADLTQLVEAVTGHRPEADVLDRLLRRADGNPFYAEELATTGDPAGAVPQTLANIALARLGGLDPDARRVMGLAAIIGERIEYPLLQAASEADGAVLDRSLREAVARSILVPASGSWGVGFRFRHELVREALIGELLPGERTATNAAVAAALETGASGAPDASGIPARIARHWIAAGDRRRALPALIDAARAAEASLAYPEAAAGFASALDAWNRLGDPVARESLGTRDITRVDVLRRAAEMAALTGSTDDAVRLAGEAVADAERSGDAERIAVAFERLGRFLWQADARERALDAMASAAAAAELIPGTQVQARVLAAQGRALAIAGQPEEARDVAQRAVAAARLAGSAGDESAAHLALGLAFSKLGDDNAAMVEFAAARRSVASASRDAPRPSEILSLVDQYAELAGALDRAGHRAESEEAAGEGASMVRRLGLPSAAAARLAAERAERAYRSGDWDLAERETRTLIDAGVPWASRGPALALRARVATGRGRYGEAADLLAQADAGGQAEAAQVTDLPTLIAIVELALWRDRLEDARRGLVAGLGVVRPGDDPWNVLELLSLGLRLEAERAGLARARRDRSDQAEAVEAADALAAQARSSVTPRDGVDGPSVVALRLLIDAERSRALGAPDPRLWSRTAEAWETAACPSQVGYARWQAAEALATERGGREAARTELVRAVAIARTLGAAPLEEQLSALARRARIDLPNEDGGDAGPADDPGRETLGLSPRELEVLELVADGRTNRQIAEALFITEKTAGHHVSNLLGKLGVASRGEAAALAHRAGLFGSPGPD